MDDLIKTMKAQLYERVSSPLFVSFILSWVAWNHRFLMMAFSDLKPEAKLYWMDALSPTWLTGLIGPLATSAFYLFVYPLLDQYVFWYQRWREQKQRQIKQRYDDLVPLSPEHSRELRVLYRKALTETEEIVSAAKVENDDLRSQLLKADAMVEEERRLREKAEHALRPISLNENQRTILALLRDGARERYLIQRSTKIPTVEVDATLEALKDAGLVAEFMTSDNSGNPVEAFRIADSGIRAMGRIEELAKFPTTLPDGRTVGAR